MIFRLLFINGKKILSRRQTSILSAAFILGVAFTLSAFLGILRDRFLYAKFYSCCSATLDAYNAAFRLPDIIFRLLVIGALSAAFVPVFTDYLSRQPSVAYRLARAVATLLVLIFLVLAGLVFIFAPSLCRFIAAGFSSTQINLMASLTRLMLLAQFFFLLSNLLTGILQAKGRFLVPALSPLVYNLGIIFGIEFLSPFWGIFGPALGVVLGAFLHFLIQFPLVRLLGFRLKPEFNFKLTGVKRVLKLTLPRTLSLGLSEIESTVILFLASSLPAGSLSLLYLAQHLGQLPSRLFGATIGQAALPSLSRLYALGKKREFLGVFLDSLFQALFLTLPVAVFILVLRIPFVRLAFGARQFPWKATLITGQVLAFLAPAVVAQTIIQILTRGFYSLQDTKTPFWTAIVSLMVVIGVSSWGVYRANWGILALVSAVSLAALFQAGILFVLFARKIGGFPWRKSGEFFGKTGLASLVAGFFAWFLMRFLDRFCFDTSRVVGLIALTVISLIGGGGIYLLLAVFLKIKQVKDYWLLLKKTASLRKMIVFSQKQIKEQPELLEPSGGF